jgi:hypothetical protein
MPSKASHKTKGGKKNFADKNTMNPTGPGQGNPPPGTNEPFEQDKKRRVGQFSGAGEPPLTRK